MHIDTIVCSPDGTVTMRTCKLGGLVGAIELLADDTAADQCPSEADASVPFGYQATRRRRGRLRVADTEESEVDMRALADFAADPNRFAGLGDEWFWEDKFQIPEPTFPFQEMAVAVAEDRLAGLTHEELAKKHGVTTPTIRKALAHAAKIDERYRNMPKKMARSRWHEDHAAEVAALKKAQGLNTQQLVEHFGKTDTTIRKALQHARKQGMDAQSG